MEALLIDGSDRSFRRLIHDLFGVTGRLESLRARFGAIQGLSGTQFGMLMALDHLEDDRSCSVNHLADQLHVRANFVTTETNKLRDSGLIEKRDNPADRRGVLLRLTPRGREFVTSLQPQIREINDSIFQPFSRADFETFSRVLGALTQSIRHAADIIERLEGEAVARAPSPPTEPPAGDRTAAS